MPANNHHIKLILLLCFCSSCIEPYKPVINEQQELIVIDGVITDKPGLHSVTVSHSTSYNNPVFAPLSGCVVSVTDNTGNMEFYTEDADRAGTYEAWLDRPFLGVGKSYSVQVVTPSERVYASDYDTLLSCPPIDSLYYKPENSGGTRPDDIWHGLQFLNDVRGDPGGTRNFRWKATATWIYHPPLIAGFKLYNGVLTPIMLDSLSTCYVTESIAMVFSASTQLLTENSIYHNRLHYVSDQTPRLRERYSLLLEQQSLTDQAYAYWEQMAVRSSNSASLYETQPAAALRGNIFNVHSPSQKVLGYFYATQMHERRIFIDCRDLGFHVKVPHCQPEVIELSSIPRDRVYFLTPDLQWAPQDCFICPPGGDTKMPDFW